MKNGSRPSQQVTYRIRVQGRLADRWLEWFPGMAAAVEVGGDGAAVTTLTGAMPDQAALRGILNKLWDLNLSLLAVEQIERAAPRSEGGSTDV